MVSKVILFLLRSPFYTDYTFTLMELSSSRPSPLPINESYSFISFPAPYSGHSVSLLFELSCIYHIVGNF